ncbi:PBSX family phage terminase large subunit [Listeria fleischmannii]|uniref:Phage terminase, large subunit, PBSX family protein n=1 Tax=Listeria fleischmannii FSL S10-1203 TaxID=1265822 RepID=W7DEQ4_9LIST|nr:PBSX family phage terminase large subunit [Listeria fleischmannii]EUJ47663.1 phage terminase, large subunit, PBSX family protein [Listeria fleischmannii FSL S10-1203]
MITLSRKQQENVYADLTGIRAELNEGTIRSGKTMSDALKMAIVYASSPDPLHLVLAYNQEQAYRMFMDCEGFGLEHIFADCGEIRHDEHGDHLWLNLPTGEKRIYYKGGGKVNAVGAITGMSFGTITFLEFNLLNKEVIEEAFRRTKVAKFRYHLIEQNPPAPNRPNLETLNQFVLTNTFRFRHWIPSDNPMLTGKRAKEWEEECKASDYLYKRDWLGERVMPQGAIYGNFDTDKNSAMMLQGKVVDAFCSADGGQSDATTCSYNLVTLYEGKYYLYRMANYYHSGEESNETKAGSVYAREIRDFINWCHTKWGYRPSRIFVDPACKWLSEELKLIGIKTDKADNNSRDKTSSNGMKIETGIERGRSAIGNQVFFLFETEEEHPYGHYHFIKELGVYTRNETTGKPIDKNNHAMDEFRYSINYFFTKYASKVYDIQIKGGE